MFCFDGVAGQPSPSPGGKWTAAFESQPSRDSRGELGYFFTTGASVLPTASFILFTDSSAKVKKEVGIINLVSQDAIAGIKARGTPDMEIQSAIIKWSSDGSNLWGATGFVWGGDDFRRTSGISFFKIDTRTWQSSLYSLPLDVPIPSPFNTDVYPTSTLNIDRGIAIYPTFFPWPGKDGSNTSTFSLNLYDFISRATSTLGSYDFSLQCSSQEAAGGSSGFYCATPYLKDQTLAFTTSGAYLCLAHSPYCNAPLLGAQWVDSYTVQWIDPATGEANTRSLR